MSIIPAQNIAIFLQKFTVTAPTATAFVANYNSVGIVTTNSPGNRQWQFTFDGSFTASAPFEIVYDFSKVNTFGFSISFEGNLNGFLNIDDRTCPAGKYLTYIPQTPQDIENKIIRLSLKPPCPQKNAGQVRPLYYLVTLNDTASCVSSNAPSPLPTYTTTLTTSSIYSQWSITDDTSGTVANGTVVTVNTPGGASVTTVVVSATTGTEFGLYFTDRSAWKSEDILVVDASKVKTSTTLILWIQGDTKSYLTINLPTRTVETYAWLTIGTTGCFVLPP